MSQRLPTPGGDDGTWGDILNGFLGVSHNSDGTIAPNTISSTQIQSGSIPSTKLDSTTQTTLAAATTAVQSINTITPSGSGAVTLTATSVGALTQSAADARYPQSGAYVATAGTVVDIRNFITSGTTFNLAAVVTAMEQYGGPCYIPPGDWTPSTFNIGLNDTSDLVTTGTAISRFTYKFMGAGKNSRIMLPSGMNSGDYLLIANSTDNLTTYEAHPKIIFEDMAVSGANSANGSFLKSNQRSFTAKRFYMASLLNGFVSTGYSDLVRLEQVYAEVMTSGGWVFTGLNNGDGLVLEQIVAYGTGGINLTGCQGATVRGCLSGWHQFINCVVTFDENHMEGDGTTSATPVITLRGCNANIRSGYYEAKKYRPTFSIDDSSGTLISRVVFHENVRLAQRIDDPSSTYGAAKAVDIDIVNLSQQSEVVFHSLRSYIFGVSTTLGNGGGPPVMIGASVTASGMSAIQTLLTQYPLRGAGEYYVHYDSGGWEITPPRPTHLTVPTKQLSPTYLSISAVNSQYFTSTLTTGTYYYQAWVKDIAARNASGQGEVSVTISSGSPVPSLLVNTQDAPVLLRIVRGTTSGTYTQYAQILVTKEVQTFYDQGTYIGGTQWSAYSNSPVVFNTGGYGETRKGYFYVDTSNAVIYGTAIPTQGNFLVGDICWNTSPSPATNILGWTCTTAGYPGTWEPFGGTDYSPFGFNFTIDPDLCRSTDFQPVSGSNTAAYLRVKDGATITKIATVIGASSGNISVGAYTNSGTGRTAVPGTLIASSGAVACPSAGYAEITLTGSAFVPAGGWLAISADNVTATFQSLLASTGDSNLGLGRQYRQSTAHPLPLTPSSLTATVGHNICLVGVP
jgi:hypothetical protein